MDLSSGKSIIPLLTIFLLGGTTVDAAGAPSTKTEKPRPRLSDHANDRAPNPDIIDAIDTASADTRFMVDVRFHEPVTVSRLGAAVSRLGISRVFGRAAGPRTAHARLGTVVKLGTMIPNDLATRYNSCQAHIVANAMSYPDGVAVDDWLVEDIHVDASAHQLRELISGSVLPPAVVTDGRRQTPEQFERLSEAVVKQMSEQKQRVPDVTGLPAVCDGFVEAPVSPVIEGSDAGLIRLSREEMTDRLASMSLDQAVTISFMFVDHKRNNEHVAALVDRYRIDGLRVELAPAYSARIIVEGKYSIHGEPLPRQVERTQCKMRLAGERVPPPSQPGVDPNWYAAWVTATLGPDAALSLLDNEDLHRVRWQARFPVARVDRVIEYFRGPAQERLALDGYYSVPAGCEHVYASLAGPSRKRH